MLVDIPGASATGQEALEDFRLYRRWAVRKGLLEEVVLGTVGFGDEALGSEAYLRATKMLIMRSGTRQTGLKPWLCWFPAVLPWDSHVTFLSLSYLVCKMES